MQQVDYKEQEVVVEKGSAKDIETVVDLSFEVFEVDRYFTFKLSREFVIDYYKIVQQFNADHFFIAKQGDKIVGFVIGYPDTNKVSKKIKKNIFKFGIKFLMRKYKIAMPYTELIKTGFKSFGYISRPEGGGELLSMAVLQNLQGKAVGSKLVHALDESFKGLITEYYVNTHTHLTLTVAFYIKMGFVKFSESKDGKTIVLKKNLIA